MTDSILIFSKQTSWDKPSLNFSKTYLFKGFITKLTDCFLKNYSNTFKQILLTNLILFIVWKILSVILFLYISKLILFQRDDLQPISKLNLFSSFFLKNTFLFHNLSRSFSQTRISLSCNLFFVCIVFISTCCRVVARYWFQRLVKVASVLSSKCAKGKGFFQGTILL